MFVSIAGKAKSPPMRLLIESLVCLLLAPSIAMAGSIGFSVSFKANEISVTNTGTEAAYQLSLWTLSPSAKWQVAQALTGNSDYLAPGKIIQVRRQSVAATTGLGRGDPLLLLVHDKAGSQITQLAWRQPPPPASYALPTLRQVGQLIITARDANAAKIVASYGITVPYAGIARLAHRFQAAGAPPDPLRHVWVARSSMTLDTGAGQSGAWLVHETAAGNLQLQIVTDGRVRGQEQVPNWLSWVRGRLMTVAQALAIFGAALMVFGLILARRKSAPASAKA